ncbi:MAG: alpha/beta fold hydrolase, partial [Ilumatobacteraceae bacterium]|nr:alpha/beta fold hydrolase [Ilumatobacteraceae bacterium]
MFTDFFTTVVRRQAVLVTGMLIISLSACSTSAPTTPTTSKNPIATSPNAQGNLETLNWKICGKFECGTINVPFDYDAPDIGTFSLHLLRRTADEPSQRIGSLLVNPGGPGFGGSTVAENAEYYLSQTLLANFDIIGWDPRGTGDSTPAVDCIDEYDEYFAADNTPNNAADIEQILALTKKFVNECKTRSGKILPYISTEATARDMDTIRAALGEKKISYFGFSYGSELGAT